MVFVTGHSGAGKSTLLKLMAAIELPSVGHRDRQRPEPRPLQARGGAVPAPQVRPHLPGPQAAVRPQRVRQRAAAARRSPASSGARRRAACAPRSTRWGCSARRRPCRSRSRAASSSASASRAPSCTVPRSCSPTSRPATSTRPTRATSCELFRSFNQVGVTVVIATHDRASERLARRTLVLSDGALLIQRSPAEARRRLGSQCDGMKAWLRQTRGRAARRRATAASQPVRHAAQHLVIGVALEPAGRAVPRPDRNCRRSPGSCPSDPQLSLFLGAGCRPPRCSSRHRAAPAGEPARWAPSATCRGTQALADLKRSAGLADVLDSRSSRTRCRTPSS